MCIFLQESQSFVNQNSLYIFIRKMDPSKDQNQPITFPDTPKLSKKRLVNQNCFKLNKMYFKNIIQIFEKFTVSVVLASPNRPN